MTKIEQWLASPADYEAGSLLYEQYGNNYNLKRCFARGANAFNIEKLHYELGKIRHLGEQSTEFNPPLKGATGDVEPPLEIALKDINPQESSVGAGIVIDTSLPPAINEYPTGRGIKNSPDLSAPKFIALDKQWKELYKVASAMQQRLPQEKNQHKRMEMAFEILDSFDAIKPIWEKIDYYKEHGHFPIAIPIQEKIEEVLTDPVKILKRIKNLSSYISHAKNDISKVEQAKKWKDEKEMYELKMKEWKN